ncbi:MAG: tRNA ((37)-N6)-dimethylallyltransferase MiaA [Pseudomonadota bacterium]|jgi:tRNA dimethylallyltransferase
MGTKDSPSDSASARPPLALIAGPTASGKSDLAVRLALALKAQGREAVVINADSAQVYADLAVLSARPSAEEMQGIAHLLFGTWDGAMACSAADWAKAARTVIAEAQARDAVPILVGGTGLYLRTLLDGIAPVPPIDAGVRAYARALPLEEARAALQREDPEAMSRLNPNDTTRIVRALEVACSTGRPLAEWQAAKVGGIGASVSLHAAVLQPDRAWLYERCDRRFDLMLERGAIAEVETLLSRDLDPALPVMRAIGVPDIGAFLRGHCSRKELCERGAQATRNYAKRQYTWFRNQPPDDWVRIDSINVEVSPHFASLLQQ